VIKDILESVTDSIRQSMSPPPIELPLFPLGSVLFPQGTMTLKIFETRYMDMAKSALKAATPFGIALISEGEEVGLPAASHPVGTLAHIRDWDMPELGVLRVEVAGGERFHVLSKTVLKSGLIIGTVELLAVDACGHCPELPACASFLQKVHSQVGIKHDAESYADASWLGFRIAELLPLGPAIKQKMLELTDARMRLEVIHRFLRQQQLIA
jgi:Lon protease-like protein